MRCFFNNSAEKEPEGEDDYDGTYTLPETGSWLVLYIPVLGEMLSEGQTLMEGIDSQICYIVYIVSMHTSSPHLTVPLHYY